MYRMADPNNIDEWYAQQDIRAALRTLDLAIKSGDISTVNTLITLNKSHEVEVPTAQYLLHGLIVAIYHSQPGAARLFIDNGANVHDNDVTSAASIGGRSLEIFEVLVEKGWDVNDLEPRGGTVLL